MATDTTSRVALTVRCESCQTWNRIEAARAADRPKCGKCGKWIPLDRPLVLTDDTFARTVSQTGVPVFVDFYADWCGPCRIMAPAVDALAAEVKGAALVAKLDTDSSPLTAGGFNIRGIPTSIVFQHGKEVARQSGALPLQGLKQLLSRAGAGI